MIGLTGLGTLVRLILRRDRWLLPIWILLPAVLVGATASALGDLYPTEEARRQFATMMSANPGITAFLGPLYGSSVGALTAWRTAMFGVVLGGLPALFSVIRHTRTEEEAGRRELIGSAVVGRHAPLTAALLVLSIQAMLMGGGVAMALVVVGEATAGAVATGSAWAGLALFCAGLGALIAQLVENPRTARGIGGATIAAAYLIRIAGDLGGDDWSWLSWLTPVGWLHGVRPFAGEQWGVLALLGAGAVTLGFLGYFLSGRRDLDAGLIAPRLGPPLASRRLRSPLALAGRLHRMSIAGWTAGIAVYGLIVGGLGPSIVDVFDDNPQLREMFERLGGEGALIDIFLSAGLGMLGLLAASAAVQAALRLRSEEQSGHAEALLATSVDRSRFMASHAILVAAGPSFAMIVGGLVTGIAYGATTGDVPSQAGRLLAAAMAQIPAVLVLGGMTLALFGLVPRFAMGAWGLLTGFLVLGQLGAILGLPRWVMNLSPFAHVPAAPSVAVRMTPLLLLTAAAAALTVAGFRGFERRDLTGV